jgi:hypothetical protein
LFQLLEVVTNAAREGARIAILPSYGTADVQDRVNNYMSDGGVPITPGTNPTIVINDVSLSNPGGNIQSKEVRVTYLHQYLFLSGLSPFFGGSFSSVPLSAVSTMRCEANCSP